MAARQLYSCDWPRERIWGTFYERSDHHRGSHLLWSIPSAGQPLAERHCQRPAGEEAAVSVHLDEAVRRALTPRLSYPPCTVPSPVRGGEEVRR